MYETANCKYVIPVAIFLPAELAFKVILPNERLHKLNLSPLWGVLHMHVHI